jgi:pyruvate-formate lyase
MENPSGNRIQNIFVGNEEIHADKYYSTVFVTLQGVPQKFGRNRKNRPERIIDVMRTYLASHHPLYAELRGTFIAV